MREVPRRSRAFFFLTTLLGGGPSIEESPPSESLCRTTSPFRTHWTRWRDAKKQNKIRASYVLPTCAGKVYTPKRTIRSKADDNRSAQTITTPNPQSRCRGDGAYVSDSVLLSPAAAKQAATALVHVSNRDPPACWQRRARWLPPCSGRDARTRRCGRSCSALAGRRASTPRRTETTAPGCRAGPPGGRAWLEAGPVRWYCRRLEGMVCGNDGASERAGGVMFRGGEREISEREKDDS